MEQYLEDYIVYKNFGEMPNEGGTGEQPYEWVEAMMAIQVAFNKVEQEEMAEQQEKERQRQQQGSGGGSGKQRFAG